MSQPQALIVDDEPDIRELLTLTLTRMGIDCHAVESIAAAHQQLRAQEFDLCLCDMRLPDGDGIDLVGHIGAHHADTPVAMITAHGNMESAIKALKNGAFDFVSKPVDLPVLRRLVESALRLRRGGAVENDPDQPRADRLIGDSNAMQQVRAMIDKLARTQAPVHIRGESGTGKELAARLIHDLGSRRSGPFVAVNCGAIPQELMESEFFGHLKGSFTGAVGDKQGLFQAADGGTLFLDEVADLPLAMQVKLLRAIQEQAVRPVGAAAEQPVDTRIISATHKDLPALVAAGEFRQDLFYRINVIELEMPPLRDRPADIPLHTAAVLERIGGDSPPQLTGAARQRLCAHSFSGNVRELENILERAIALSDGGRIDVDDLGLPATGAETGTGADAGNGQAGDAEDLENYLQQMERQRIVAALEETRWNRTAAAKKLGISFRALRYRLEKLGLDRPD